MLFLTNLIFNQESLQILSEKFRPLILLLTTNKAKTWSIREKEMQKA